MWNAIGESYTKLTRGYKHKYRTFSYVVGIILFLFSVFFYVFAFLTQREPPNPIDTDERKLPREITAFFKAPIFVSACILFGGGLLCIIVGFEFSFSLNNNKVILISYIDKLSTK